MCYRVHYILQQIPFSAELQASVMVRNPSSVIDWSEFVSAFTPNVPQVSLLDRVFSMYLSPNSNDTSNVQDAASSFPRGEQLTIDIKLRNLSLSSELTYQQSIHSLYGEVYLMDQSNSYCSFLLSNGLVYHVQPIQSCLGGYFSHLMGGLVHHGEKSQKLFDFRDAFL